MKEEPVKSVVVSQAQTRAQVRTVVVQLKHTCAALGAVVAAGWLEHLACLAEGELEEVRGRALIHLQVPSVEICFALWCVVAIRHFRGPVTRWQNAWVCQNAPHHVVIDSCDEVHQDQ